MLDYSEKVLGRWQPVNTMLLWFQSFLCWIIRKKYNFTLEFLSRWSFQSFLCWIIRKKYHLIPARFKVIRFNPSYVGLFGKSSAIRRVKCGFVFCFNPSYVGLFGKSWLAYREIRGRIEEFQSFLCWIIRKKRNTSQKPNNY